MIESLLYDFIEMSNLGEYRDKLKSDENDIFAKYEREAWEKLEKALTKEQIKLVDSYTHQINMREEYIDSQTEIKLLNYGIKIGMQLQKAFDDEKS